MIKEEEEEGRAIRRMEVDELCVHMQDYGGTCTRQRQARPPSLSDFFFNRCATSSADKSQENKITSTAELAERLRGPNLTINQLFDRNHQSILVVVGG